MSSVGENTGETPEVGDTAPGSGGGTNVAPGYVPRLLSAAAHLTSLAVESTLEQLGLTRRRYNVLELLALEPVSETELAERAGLTTVAVREDLLHLFSSGYVTRGDGSGAWVITPTGSRAVEHARMDVAEATLKAEDNEELRQELRTLIKSLRLKQPRTEGFGPGL